MLSVAQLSVFDTKRYTDEVKACLRDDASWPVLELPPLRERTRATLVHMVASIDAQIARSGTSDLAWLRSIEGLRKFTQRRLDAMPERIETARSANKETRAWKGLAVALAHELEEHDPAALDRLKTPYGALSVREWMIVREEV